MKYGNHASIWRTLSSSLISLLVLTVLFIILAKAFWTIHQKALLSSTKLSEAAVELSKLKGREIDLASKVNYLSTDQGIEAEIRTKYRAVKNGEMVAVIVGDTETTSPKQGSTTTQTSWWHNVLDIIGM